MVDRIVPATTAATIADVGGLIGVDDRCPVPAEDFTMWVLEDDFAAGRPAWDRAGPIMSDEVEAYELGQTAPTQRIAFPDRVPGAPRWSPHHRRRVGAGIRPRRRADVHCHRVPADDRTADGFDVDVYVDSLSHRWANSALGHRTSQVCTDGSVKLLQRIPEPAQMALRDGRVPHLLALTVAGWIATVAPPPGLRPWSLRRRGP